MKVSERFYPVRTPNLLSALGFSNLRWLLNRTLSILRKEGAGGCFRRMESKFKKVLRGESTIYPFESTDPDTRYQQWRRRHTKPALALEAMLKELADLASPPSIVLVVMLSTADARLLRMAIQSLCAQAYPHWQLLLWSPSEVTPSVEEVVKEFTECDKRITYERDPLVRSVRDAWDTIPQYHSANFMGVMGQHDELAPEALCVTAKHIVESPQVEILYSDQDSITAGGWHCDPIFKPDWSPDLLLSMNYVSSLCLFRRTVLEAMGALNVYGLQDAAYPLLLRIAERESVVEHIPEVLYHQRRSSASEKIPAPVIPSASAQIAAVEEALRRRGERAEVTRKAPGRVQIDRQPDGAPLASIIIPTRDGCDLLKRCLDSIETKTTYKRYEIIVLDNESVDSSTLSFLDNLKQRWRVVRCPGDFNFSSVNNIGARYAKGEYLLFLNNDIEVRTGDWLKDMLAQAQRRGVGSVGAKLLYPDGSIQHAGVVVGIQGNAGHAFRHQQDDGRSYYGLADTVRNCSAVTAACMMVPKEVFRKVNGFDEQLRVEFNDVDLCLKIRRQGYRIVYAPEAVLYHHENATRKGRRSPQDEMRFTQQWGELIAKGDPYYNPNLTLRREDWSLDA